jgi:hypothetical protein
MWWGLRSQLIRLKVASVYKYYFCRLCLRSEQVAANFSLQAGRSGCWVLQSRGPNYETRCSVRPDAGEGTTYPITATSGVLFSINFDGLREEVLGNEYGAQRGGEHTLIESSIWLAHS